MLLKPLMLIIEVKMVSNIQRCDVHSVPEVGYHPSLEFLLNVQNLKYLMKPDDCSVFSVWSV